MKSSKSKGRFPLTFALPARAKRSLLLHPSRPREQIFKARSAHAGKATAMENGLNGKKVSPLRNIPHAWITLYILHGKLFGIPVIQLMVSCPVDRPQKNNMESVLECFLNVFLGNKASSRPSRFINLQC
jgi:hypothetical protein